MAVATYTVVRTNVVGNQREVDVTVACDDDYPTGGYPIAAADVGLSEIYGVSTAVGAGFVFQFESDGAGAGTILAYIGDNNNAADGPLIEAASSADLAAVTALPLTIRGI